VPQPTAPPRQALILLLISMLLKIMSRVFVNVVPLVVL
jgi:hypothetical protein